MRLLALLLLAGSAWAIEAKDLFVVRITTEQPSVSGPARRTLEAVALPVGGDGLVLAVGFALDPPDSDAQGAIRVAAVAPDGSRYEAELVGGDDELGCTLIRVKVPADKAPAPVALKGVPLENGAEVTLLARHGELFRYAPRTLSARIGAVRTDRFPLYAVAGQPQSWAGAVAVAPDGRLVGFVHTRDTVREGSGGMYGIGGQTLVIVAADSYAEFARTLPLKNRHRAWIGVNLAPFDADKEAFFNTGPGWYGALVTGVAPGSPGDKAGLRVHDLVKSIGSLRVRFEKLDDWSPMLRAVQRLPLGVPLDCKVVRFVRRADGNYDSHELDLKLTLAERPLDFQDAPETGYEELGLRVKPAAQDWRRSRRVPEEGGVVVTRTEHASPAQLARLRLDDLILRVDDQPIADVAAFTKTLNEAKRAGRKKLVFFVRRGAETLFLALQTDWK